MLLPVFFSVITFILITFVYKVIWVPFRIQRMMRSQGITGPSYKLMYGSTKESHDLKAKLGSPMELSHDIFPHTQPHFYHWIKLYGKNVLTWVGTQPHLIVTEPVLAKEILTDKQGFFRKIKTKGSLKKLVGDSLVMADGARWLKLRKIANHAFYAESLKEMIPAMTASVETMLESWKHHEAKEIDVSKEVTLMSSEVISRTAFGSSYVEGKNVFDKLTELGVLVIKAVDKIRPFAMVWKNADDVESEKIEQSLIGSVKSIVRRREEKMDDFGSDFLGSLLRAHHDEDEKNRISIGDIIDECKLFFLAGHETTSSLLSWTLLLLAIHSDWQQKAREEAVQMFGQENPMPEVLPKMKITSMIMHEVLRLYTPTGSLVRRASSNVKVGKYEFPAGMEFHILSLALHRDEEIWGKDAHVFKPERFENGVAAATKNKPMAFLPFGFGPRTCVGLNFANNEVKIALCMILRRYKFTLSPNYVHSPISLITTRPLHGVPIILQRIQH